MAATESQVRDLANAIALQAEALNRTTFDATLYAKVRLLAENVDTLKTWTEQLNPARCPKCQQLPSQGHGDDCNWPANHA